MLTFDPVVTARLDSLAPRFVKILRGCVKPKSEDVLIITDLGLPDRPLASWLAYGYYAALRKHTGDVHLVVQGIKKGFMFADDHVVSALERLPEKSIVIACVSNKLGRIGSVKSFRNFCRDRGHRFLSATGLGDVSSGRFDLFLEAMGINYVRLRRTALRIKKQWDKAKSIRVTTPLGTDVTFDVSEMESRLNVGDYFTPGSGGNMPAGEVYIAPKGTAGVSGKVVIDGSMKTVDGALLLESPVTLTIENGRVVDVSGEQAHLLMETFERFENRAKYPERIRLIGELGIGLNPGAVLIGSMIMDEKVLGTGHIAIGSNSWFGGAIKTIYHGDQVFKDPTFYVDGKEMKV